MRNPREFALDNIFLVAIITDMAKHKKTPTPAYAAVLSVQEAAAYAGISPRYVAILFDAGKITGRICGGRKVRRDLLIDRASLAAWLKLPPVPRRGERKPRAAG